MVSAIIYVCILWYTIFCAPEFKTGWAGVTYTLYNVYNCYCLIEYYAVAPTKEVGIDPGLLLGPGSSLPFVKFCWGC